MLAKELRLSAPWVILYRKITAMFQLDSDVTIVFDEENKTIKLYVSSQKKAAALDNLLIHEHVFGDTTVNVIVYFPNGAVLSDYDMVYDYDEMYEEAFFKNGACDRIEKIHHPLLPGFTYVIFKQEVVQYFIDDIGDYFGIESTLYEDIARDIFKYQPNVFFCTDILKEM